jgi:hypothetical protein
LIWKWNKTSYQEFIMRIASFSTHFSGVSVWAAVVAPLQGLLSLLVPQQAASANTASFSRHTSPHCSPHQATGHVRSIDSSRWLRGNTQVALKQVCNLAQQPSTSRLKIVRQFEPGVGPACAGRMVISGRMADVCAELDRMAEREGLAARV